MTHAGKKAGLGAIALLCGHQLRSQAFALNDLPGDAAEQYIHHKNENAAAKENAGHDEVRIAEKANGKIAQQEGDQQRNRYVEYAVFLVPCLHVSYEAGETNEADDIVNHQQTSQIDHASGDPLSHVRHLLLTKTNGILHFIIS